MLFTVQTRLDALRRELCLVAVRGLYCILSTAKTPALALEAVDITEGRELYIVLDLFL